MISLLSSKSGEIQISSFIDPIQAGKPSGRRGMSGLGSAMAISRTTGLPLRAMTTSSPASACSMSLERLVLA